MLALGIPFSPPNRMMGTEEPQPGTCFKCWSLGKKTACPSSQLLLRPCPNCGQAGHWGDNCPTFPRQSRPVPPKFLLHRKVCQIFWFWQLKIDAALISLPQVTLEESEEAIEVASKYLSSRLVLFKSQITLMAKVIILVS